MRKKILAVHPNPDMLDIIENILENTIDNTLYQVFPICRARSQEEAETAIQENPCDLVIINLDIPYDRKIPVLVGGAEQRGLLLAKSWREKNIAVPILIVAAHVDDSLYKAADSADVELILEGESFEETLIKKSSKCLSTNNQSDNGSKNNVDLDIFLDTKDRCSYRIRRNGEYEDRYEKEGYLNIDSDELSDLVTDSQYVSQYGCNWEKKLREIGKRLSKQIFDKNISFYVEFISQLARVNGKASIRFVVDKSIYPIALEALLDHTQKYWMLQAPLYRRIYGIPGERHALFQDDKTKQELINCLIIESNAYGYVEGLDFQLKPLGNVPEEATWLENYLCENQNSFGIGQVRRVFAKEGKSLKTEVERLLKSDVWHLVHYAGHSYCDQKTGFGYVFFPDSSGGGAEKVGILRFANWLVNTRFVYLSSCHSSEEDFVFQLVNKYIPAVAGFRWDIDDDKAVEYTQSFYRHLFEGKKCLEYAFLEARQELYEEYREEHPIWAAPMLVIQMSE